MGHRTLWAYLTCTLQEVQGTMCLQLGNTGKGASCSSCTCRQGKPQQQQWLHSPLWGGNGAIRVALPPLEIALRWCGS